MGVYFLILFLILFLWVFNNRVKFVVGNRVQSNDKKKVYIVFIGLIIFSFAALRNYTVGSDALTYLQRYSRFANAEWKNIFHISDKMMFEYGFAVINKLLSYISRNPRFFLIITVLFIVYSYCLAIYKYSEIPWLSFLIFITLGLFGSSLSALRQYIAIGIIILSYDAILNNQLLKYITLVVMAYSVHTSALIVLPMFWLSKIKFNKTTISAAGIGFLGMVFLFFRHAKEIGNILAPYIFTYSRYFYSLDTSLGKGAVGETIIYFAFLVLILIELYRSEDEARNTYIAFAIMSAVLILFSYMISICARLLPYFSSMFLFSVPKAITSEKRSKNRFLYLIIICVVLLFYYFAVVCRADTCSVIPYELWNDKYRLFD